MLFCETQWRHLVKTRLYKNLPTYFIVLAIVLAILTEYIISFSVSSLVKNKSLIK